MTDFLDGAQTVMVVLHAVIAPVMMKLYDQVFVSYIMQAGLLIQAASGKWVKFLAKAFKDMIPQNAEKHNLEREKIAAEVKKVWPQSKANARRYTMSCKHCPLTCA